MQPTLPGIGVDRLRIGAHVNAGHADPAAGADHIEHAVERRVRLLGIRVGAETVRLVADRVDAGIHLRFAQDLRDLVAQRRRIAQVDGLEAGVPQDLQAVGILVADDNAGRAQQPGAGGGAAADRSGTGDIDVAAGPHAGGVGAVKAGRQDGFRWPARPKAIAEHGRFGETA